MGFVAKLDSRVLPAASAMNRYDLKTLSISTTSYRWMPSSLVRDGSCGGTHGDSNGVPKMLSGYPGYCGLRGGTTSTTRRMCGRSMLGAISVREQRFSCQMTVTSMIVRRTMPTRYLKESINTSRNMAQLTHGAERMCTRLFTRADDYGRFDADPKVIKGGCFPLIDNITIEDVVGWKKELVREGLVRYYRVDGREYGYFVTWEKHQGKPRAKASKYPQPPAPAGVRRQLRALAGKRGQPPTHSPVVRSALSNDRNRSSSSEVRSGPQSIGFAVAKLAEDLEAK